MMPPDFLSDLGQDYANRFGELFKFVGANAEPKEPALVPAAERSQLTCEGFTGGKNVEIVLYCGGGFRSALAADNLQKMGYTNVVNVDGGWRALKDLMDTEASG